MVFISLEGFLDAAVNADTALLPSTRPQQSQARALDLPKPPVHVVVTPGSPVKPVATTVDAKSAASPGKKRSRLRRAASSFAGATRSHSLSPTGSTSASSSALASQFVLYVTDRDVHHKWVLSKTPPEYLHLKKTLPSVVGSCRKFACCGPLRRILNSPHYKSPKRRWSDSRMASQFVHCTVMQEYLNDLLLAVIGRESQCEATTRAWDMLSAFLNVEQQRSDVADSILLTTLSESPRSAKLNHRVRRLSHCQSAPAVLNSSTSDQENVDPDQAAYAGEECPICCSAIAKDECASRLLCGHTYHAECVRVWLRMQHTCPVCRIPIE